MAPIVKTLQGALEGSEGVDVDGNRFYQFLGIPFAKPPLGELRFKDPQPPESWIGIRDATIEGNSCYQENGLTKQIEGSEDCLNLNVFTRYLPEESEELKPVMVWIHGGAFIMGSNSRKMYGPEYLLSQDVVLVSINYRLGILGFLQLKDTSLHITGNMGFKDQVAALRWVKNNIRQFNGDTNNITIFGESAGSASVHYHILSPLSSDLFHKAILQSGAALNPWADETNHSVVHIARLGNRNIDTEKEALNYLKRLSVDELYKLQVQYTKGISVGAIRPFGLVVDSAKKSGFMPRRPIDIITSGEYNKVPVIFGYTDREGITLNETHKLTGEPPYISEDFMPFNVNFKSNANLRRTYVDKLKNAYFRGSSPDDGAIAILSDASIIVGVLGATKNHAQTSPYPVYLYKFILDTELNVLKRLLNVSHVPGCSHADDIGYLFKNIASPAVEPGSAAEKGLRTVLKLWTNFARYNNPTPEEEELGIIWRPVKARQINALIIGENLTMQANPEGKRIELWKEIYSQSPATAKYL